MSKLQYCAVSALLLISLSSVTAQDLDNAIEHPLVTRYPGQEIRWQQIENYLPYRVPVGPVTGYRKIDDWIDTEGRVTRTFYRYQGTDRTYSEIFQNYLEALEAQGLAALSKVETIWSGGVSPDATNLPGADGVDDDQESVDL